MAEVPISTATSGASALIATNLVTRDSGLIENMQLINIGDWTTGQGANVNSTGALSVASAPASPTITNGSITTATSAVSAMCTTQPTITVSIGGTYAGVNISFQAYDPQGWYAINAVRSDSSASETTSGVLTNTSRSWSFNAVGYTIVRVLATAWTSGTATIYISTVALSTEMNPVVSIPQTVTTTVSSGTVNLGTTSGTQTTLYTNSTLAATTNSTTATMNYCNSCTLFFTGTGSASGTVSIYGSSDNVTFFALPSPASIAVTTTAATTVLSLLPCRYYYIKSTVALSALSVQFQGSY